MPYPLGGVGVYLPEPVFGHRQLDAAALSRTKHEEYLNMLIVAHDNQGNLLNNTHVFARNVVLKELL